MLTIDVAQQYSGAIIEELGKRRGELVINGSGFKLHQSIDL